MKAVLMTLFSVGLLLFLMIAYALGGNFYGDLADRFPDAREPIAWILHRGDKITRDGSVGFRHLEVVEATVAVVVEVCIDAVVVRCEKPHLVAGREIARTKSRRRGRHA
ncbi:MAG: hypothetical protein IKL96_10615 [Kiritimatiellae bacterium]|nr:hypothetical protein [Kiritimatiellia bacterium]